MKEPKDMTEEELEGEVKRQHMICDAALDAEENARREHMEALLTLNKLFEERDRRRSTPPGGAK